MTGVPWRLPLLTLGFLLNLFLVIGAVRWLGPSKAAPEDDHHGDGPVECTECGTANDPEYRFCRKCVEELPGSSPLGRSVSSTTDELRR